MKAIRFVVKVNRVGNRHSQYVRQIDRTPIQMTNYRKRALIIGKFTAEDILKSIQNSECSAELVPVHVTAA
jgi:hypothetical protein